MQIPYQADLKYSIPVKYGDCSIQVIGSFGSRFILTQSPLSCPPDVLIDSAAKKCSDERITIRGRVMANEMPSSDKYQGLSRKVLQYSEGFLQVIGKLKKPGFSEADWAPMDELVDVQNFKRVGVFLTSTAETSNWQHYKQLVTQYAGNTSWEGTLRRITEVPGLVYLELEERNMRAGVMDVSNTVTIYKFNAAGKLTHLDVYVAHMGTR
jgi:hypothetical protein